MTAGARQACPSTFVFKTKPQIALDQFREACEAGLPRGVVLMDAGYGANTDLRTDIAALGLTYVAGILPNTTVWAPGMAPLRPKRWSGRGRPPRLMRRDRNHQPISVKELALSLPAKAWRIIAWREGSAEKLTSRFARLRVRVAHRDYNLTKSRPGQMPSFSSLSCVSARSLGLTLRIVEVAKADQVQAALAEIEEWKPGACC